MSTKSTLAHGPGFHLYHECFEQDTVYLELEKTHFECYPDRVTVAIPVVAWEVIGNRQGGTFPGLQNRMTKSGRMSIRKSMSE